MIRDRSSESAMGFRDFGGRIVLLPRVTRAPLEALRRVTKRAPRASHSQDKNRYGVIYMFDMRNLTRLKKLDENAPESMKAFWAFDKEAFKDGAIDVLHKQLMAVAVALTTQCPYCIELHVRAARQAGANDAMLT